MPLTAPRDTPQWGLDKVILNLLEVPLAASTKLQPGQIVSKDTSGNLVAGAADTTQIVCGVLDPGSPGTATDNSSGAAGALTGRVLQGVFHVDNQGNDLVVAGDRFLACYLVDDHTVAHTNSSNTRPFAGIVIDVDSTGVWVAIGAQLQPFPASTVTNISQLQTQVGQGNPEEISASGALSTARRTTRLAVSGTKAWTLADGTTAGQRKTIFCVSQAATPVGVVTPAHGSGFTTLTFGASSANASVELEWDASLGTPAWKIVGIAGTVTVA